MLRWGVVSLLQFAIVDQMINPRIVTDAMKQILRSIGYQSKITRA